MAQLEFTIKNQTIQRNDNFVVVAKSQNYLYAHFTFTTDDWDDIDTRTAIFTKGAVSYRMLLDANFECLVPWEVLADVGTVLVSVFGGDLITVNKASVYVGSTGYTTNTKNGGEATPSIYDQILSVVRTANEEAQTYAETAGTAAQSAVQSQGVVEGLVENAQTYAQQTEDYAELVEQWMEESEDGIAGAVADYMEDHPIVSPVQSVNNKTGAVVLSASDVGALPSDTVIPDLTGYATELWVQNQDYITQETDPTVPEWAKEPNKPVYTASEVGALPDDTVIPTQLPNPNKLILTGAVSAEYDGSSPVTVNIPSGGGGGGAVDSVNGKTGVVVLDADDVGALPVDTVIPTETTVAGWGFTKNTGTYSKPSSGIPKSDLASGVQDSLDLADTALQSHQSLIGYATETWVTQQGFLTSHQDISGKANVTTVVSKTSADTSQTLAADTFYVWPEMSALTITCPATGMYAFRFTSGSTATTLTMTGITMPDGFTVEADKVYEINIYNGYGVAQSWSVSA